MQKWNEAKKDPESILMLTEEALHRGFVSDYQFPAWKHSGMMKMRLKSRTRVKIVVVPPIQGSDQILRDLDNSINGLDIN